MKLFTWNRRLTALSLALCLGAAVLTGCGSKEDAAVNEESAETAESAETTEGAAETAADELKEYAVEGVGTFYLPDGFTVESGTSEEGLPMTWAVLTKDSVTVSASRFGEDAYEAAGLSLPADMEEYSQRDGARQGLPEGAEFTQDSYGNTCVEFTEDGEVTYHALKMSDTGCGGFLVVYPEGEEAPDCGAWASAFVLE